jgi:pyruvate dehydrogenase E1 component beta subunit
MVHECLEAAVKFENMGISAEVIDLRTLRPLDTKTVFDSVKKTNRIVIVEEVWQTGGFSGELVSSVQEECFDYLDGPVGRVSGLDVPAPYNGTLEASTIPDSDKIIEAVRRLYGI